MKKKKVKKTVGIRVFREDWRILKALSKREGRTLQNMFGIAVNVASKVIV